MAVFSFSSPPPFLSPHKFSSMEPCSKDACFLQNVWGEKMAVGFRRLLGVIPTSSYCWSFRGYPYWAFYVLFFFYYLEEFFKYFAAFSSLLYFLFLVFFLDLARLSFYFLLIFRIFLLFIFLSSHLYSVQTSHPFVFCLFLLSLIHVLF